MKVFIVEDEFAAQANLRRLLTTCFSDIEIVGVADSVYSAVLWLQQNDADIIFMDVELSDGTCFEIFQQIDITAKVIITTAYDNYAIRAFRVNSIDYLLKPVDKEQLVEAVNKCRISTDTPSAGELFRPLYTDTESPAYKQRFIVRLGDQIRIVKVEDIAYFISKEKTTYLVTSQDKRYIVDFSLDAVETKLDPSLFFRVSRQCITNINSIKLVTRHFSGRLKLQLLPACDDDIFVSRVRTSDFMHWINQ